MSSKRPSAHRILAIAPKSRGFGFIVMESITTPVDWGMRTARESSINAEVVLLTKIQDLLAHYQPDYLIFLLRKGHEQLAVGAPGVYFRPASLQRQRKARLSRR